MVTHREAMSEWRTIPPPVSTWPGWWMCWATNVEGRVVWASCDTVRECWGRDTIAWQPATTDIPKPEPYVPPDRLSAEVYAISWDGEEWRASVRRDGALQYITGYGDTPDEALYDLRDVEARGKQMAKPTLHCERRVHQVEERWAKLRKEMREYGAGWVLSLMDNLEADDDRA